MENLHKPMCSSCLISSLPALRPWCDAAKDFSHSLSSPRRLADCVDREVRRGVSRMDVRLMASQVPVKLLTLIMHERNSEPT